MEKKLVTALGELLIDYTPMKKSPSGMAVYEENAGGAPANVMACVKKFGIPTAFLGKVGQDAQGEFLRKTLCQAGINTQGLISDPDFFTTLAFVSLSDSGERSFSFARKPGADTQLKKEEVDLTILECTEIFHFGSLSLTHSPSREATLFALEQCKNQGILVSYDPNYRPLLWESPEIAKTQMRSVLPFVNLIKISEEECQLMTGYAESEKAIEILLAQNVSVVLVTLGAEGAYVGTKEGIKKITGFSSIEVVDTTGAGDTFLGSTLWQLMNETKNLEEISLERWCSMTHFSNAAASLCVEKRGAIPALPTLEEVLERINK